MSRTELVAKVMEVLARARAKEQSCEEQELLSIAMDAVLFIASTGQRYAFEDFRKHLASNALPEVVATFDTRAEADAWLSNHPEPPDSTFVLIAGKYHIVFYRRETNLRRMIPDPVLEFHLGRLKRSGLPPVMASFNTRKEADVWLGNQTEPLEQAVILIAGEPYLAAHHRNVNCRAIYPFSMAVEY
jgi:hypothetical protein